MTYLFDILISYKFISGEEGCPSEECPIAVSCEVVLWEILSGVEDLGEVDLSEEVREDR